MICTCALVTDRLDASKKPTGEPVSADLGPRACLFSRGAHSLVIFLIFALGAASCPFASFWFMDTMLVQNLLVFDDVPLVSGFIRSS
jgi:hypothetical protein